MKRFLLLAACFALICSPLQAGAAEKLKIGYVDLQEALNTSEAGKKAKEMMKSDVDVLQKDIDKKKAELDKMSAELEKQAYLLSEDTKVKKEKEFQEKAKELQRFFQDAQERLQEKDQQFMRKIVTELREIIFTIGQEKGYSMILEQGEINILYADKTMDLTSEVVRRYNDSKTDSKK